MAASATLCEGTCIWVFKSGSWTVSSSSCATGCGCVDSGSAAKFNATGKLVVPHAEFLARVKTMLSDTRLSGLINGPRLQKQLEPTSPSDGQTFETVCMN
jgi:hypothetical protein